jgi:hypothetical protein
VQELFLDAVLHGHALIPVHALTKYERAHRLAPQFATAEGPSEAGAAAAAAAQRHQQRRRRRRGPYGRSSDREARLLGGGIAAAAARSRAHLPATRSSAGSGSIGGLHGSSSGDGGGGSADQGFARGGLFAPGGISAATALLEVRAPATVARSTDSNAPPN